MIDARTRSRALFAAASLCALLSARCSGGPQATDGTNPDDAGASATGSTPDASTDGPGCSDDVKSDPKNCGRCGHDCLGGGCSGGQCQPIILASDQITPTDLLIDATHAYFTTTEANGIARVPLAGGDAQDLSVQTVYRANIAIDDTSVYFMSFGGFINRIPKDGVPDGGTPQKVSGGSPNAMPILAVDDVNVYWTTGSYQFFPTIPGKIYAVAKDGTGVGGLPLATSGGVTTSMAIDGTFVYVSQGPGIAGSASGRIVAMPKGTLSNGVIAPAQANPTGLLVSGGKLYWANAGNGTLKTMDVPGDAGATPSQVFASGQNQPARIAKDDVAFYFTNRGSGTIASCPVSGCTDVARVIASDQAAPVGIAVDAVAIYWANSGNGTIMKVAK